MASITGSPIIKDTGGHVLFGPTFDARSAIYVNAAGNMVIGLPSTFLLNGAITVQPLGYLDGVSLAGPFGHALKGDGTGGAQAFYSILDTPASGGTQAAALIGVFMTAAKNSDDANYSAGPSFSALALSNTASGGSDFIGGIGADISSLRTLFVQTVSGIVTAGCTEIFRGSKEIGGALITGSSTDAGTQCSILTPASGVNSTVETLLLLQNDTMAATIDAWAVFNHAGTKKANCDHTGALAVVSLTVGGNAISAGVVPVCADYISNTPTSGASHASGNTAATETTLYLSQPLTAGLMAANNARIVVHAALAFATSINTDKRIRVYVRESATDYLCFDSGGLAITTASKCNLDVDIQRTGSATGYSDGSITTGTAALAAFADQRSLTPTWANTIQIKITGSGTSANDVTYSKASAAFYPAV